MPSAGWYYRDIEGELDGPLGLSLLVHYDAKVDMDGNIEHLEIDVFSELALDAKNSVYLDVYPEQLHSITIADGRKLHDALYQAARQHVLDRIADGEFSVERPY